MAKKPRSQAITYSIEGGADAALFNIDPVTGALSFKVAPDFENPTDANRDNIYELIIGASDGTDMTTQSGKVTIKDVLENPTNLPPVFESPAEVTIDENITAVGTVRATDPDAGGGVDPEPPPSGDVYVLPEDRVTLWKPGVTYNGGIPNRTTIYKTLSPSGGSDTAQIQNAINSCPPNQVVQLTAGTFKITNAIIIRKNNITLRGAGPGTGCSGGIHTPADGKGYASVLQGNGTGTFLVLQDRGGAGNNTNIFNIGDGYNSGYIASRTNLASDAAQGSYSCTLVNNPGIAVGEYVLVNQVCTGDSDVHLGSFAPPYNSGDPGQFGNCESMRPIGQVLQVTAVAGNTVTFATPFGHAMKTAFSARLTRFPANPNTGDPSYFIYGVGIEELAVMGGTNNGNFTLAGAAYCWVKHIESYYGAGSARMTMCYRCEFRDSYFHETPQAYSGGAGYLTACTFHSSDCLFENNIMWNGNKVITCQGVGPGNVIAYNYMDDAWQSSYPMWPESGVNYGHNTCGHMGLIEGNWSHKFSADNYWGNQIDVTCFRNHFTALRGARLWVNGYVNSGGWLYLDQGGGTGRNAVDILAFCWRHNFVGNVLGMEGQTLLPFYDHGGYQQLAQTGPVYETVNGVSPGSNMSMWVCGGVQFGGDNLTWEATTIRSQLRQGNWDWFTKTQTFYTNPIGGKGHPGNGTPQAISNSLYLSAKPAFFGSKIWPWVDPTNGATHVLPAKARFDAGTPNQL